MSVTTTYPGVHVTETPSGSRTTGGVATSITAFVGTALRGPVDEPVPIASLADFERAFGGLWRDSGLAHAVRDFYLNGGGEALVVRVVHVDETDDAASAASATLDVGGLGLETAGPGAWGNELHVVVTHPTGTDAADVAAGQGVEAADLFSLVVREGPPGGTGPSETYLDVTTVEGPRRVDVVLGASRTVRTTGALPTSRPAEGTYDVTTGTQGRDGEVPGLRDYQGDADAKTGLYALLKADLFNLLCIPPPTPGTDVPDPLWSEAAALCRQQRAFLIVDAPAGATVDGTAGIASWVTGTAGLTGTDVRNAALYFPRVRRPDPLRGGATASFAACGAVAGTFARTDGSRGVWTAPAGIEAGLVGVVGLTTPLTDAENGRLSSQGVNCLRTFPGVGPVVWGARTLRGSDVLADEYKYVPVRRLALFMEQTLYRSTQWVVFEPNDEPLWGQVRASVGAFLQDLFRRGAFQGSTPRDAYFVRCDADTTTQHDVDRGVVNVLVGFAPLKPAEFVVIGIQQKTASAGARRDHHRGGAEDTAGPTVDATRFDPYENFKFRVKWDGRYVAGISKVGALERTTEVVTHRSGDDPSSSRTSSGRPGHEAIVLSRGVTHDADFERWASRGWDHASGLGSQTSPEDFRKDVTLELYDEVGRLAVAYTVHRCWVSEFQAMPDLDASADAVAIASITLENEGWERDDLVGPSQPSLVEP